MNTAQWARAAEVFADLVDLSSDDRRLRIGELCNGDGELVAAVERLLARHDQQDDGDTLIDGVSRVVSAWSPTAEVSAGSNVGPYRILRSLGEGGMGEVYLAERDIDDGIQRVALKLPQQRPGRRFIERFHRERGILASLGHPAIARLLDSGTLADGRPFFAMEYVDGLSITDYCDRHQLGIRERIRLFALVLPAVAHAHQQFVLHRDIKAGNVLVGDDGLPRLVDFGIAKSVDVLSENVTLDGAQFFSLASAAPEQIAGATTGITTDIYALGAMLYELVCGLPALDLADLPPAAALHAIAEQVPLPPAVAIGRLSTKAPDRARELATSRSLGSASALGRELRGDLALILQRALHKSPRSRYATADALASDLRALLEHRPIAQRRSDRLYRLLRFVQRHRVAVAGMLVAGLLSAVYLTLAWRQASVIALERDRAEMGREQSEQVTAFLVNLFRNADPAVARGNNPDAREMLARGARAIEAERQLQPAVRGTLLVTLAEIDLSINEFAEARHLGEMARDTLQPTDDSQSAIQQRVTLLLVRAALAQADYEEALQLIDGELQGHALGPESSEFSLTLFALRAAALAAGTDLDHALELFSDVESEMRRRYGATDVRTRAITRRWSLALSRAGKTAEAQELAATAAGDEPLTEFSNDPDTARLAYQQAIVLRNEGKLAQAEQLARDALRIDWAIYGEWHSETAAAFNVLATIAQQQNKPDAAVGYFERALGIMEHLYPENHPARAMAQYNLGTMQLHYQNDAKAALVHLSSAVEQASISLSPDHPNLAIFRLALGQALRDLGETDAAEQALSAAHQRFVIEAAPRGRNEASAAGDLACIALAKSVDPKRATVTLERAIGLLSAEMGKDHPKVARLARCLSEH